MLDLDKIGELVLDLDNNPFYSLSTEEKRGEKVKKIEQRARPVQYSCRSQQLRPPRHSISH